MNAEFVKTRSVESSNGISPVPLEAGHNECRRMMNSNSFKFVHSRKTSTACLPCRDDGGEESKCDIVWTNRFSNRRRTPPSIDGSSDILALTAKELNAMTLQDREALFEEIQSRK